MKIIKAFILGGGAVIAADAEGARVRIARPASSASSRRSGLLSRRPGNPPLLTALNRLLAAGIRFS